MDHLFISYAVEDAPLARWLTLKLTIEGYKVWCFEFEMLGGESFPKEIGEAIKTGTFRMLALISHSSVKKSNPIKEWTLGQALGAERKLDFVIPLNVDGVRPTELPWTMSDISWVSFYSAGWAGGFRQLLKLLEKISAPRPLQNGAAISAQTFIPEELVTSAPELLYSNTLRFRNIPELLKAYRWKRPLKENESSETSMLPKKPRGFRFIRRSFKKLNVLGNSDVAADHRSALRDLAEIKTKLFVLFFDKWGGVWDGARMADPPSLKSYGGRASVL